MKEDPFVIVKADAGTYGMGIMTVKDASEVRDLNRKQRNKMAVVKEGLQVHDVLVQEGVYTFENIDGAVAEPVIYMVDHFVVGGFYRVHTGRGVDENLNAPGMQLLAARVRILLRLPQSRLRAGRHAQPLLRLRRGGKAGDAGGSGGAGRDAAMTFISRLVFLSLALLLSACGKEPFYQEQAYVFGTQVDVSIYGADEAKARQATVAVMHEFQRLHDMLHAWKPSELSALNTAIAQGKSKHVSSELAAMLKDAAHISAQSGGLFNPGYRRADPGLGLSGGRFQGRAAG